jgi:hypothetical protein
MDMDSISKLRNQIKDLFNQRDAIEKEYKEKNEDLEALLHLALRLAGMSRKQLEEMSKKELDDDYEQSAIAMARGTGRI